MTGGDLNWTIAVRQMARIAVPLGRVDESTAAAFAERLLDEVEMAFHDGTRRLVIDLANITYMSSRGLRSLTLAQRKATDHEITIVLARPNGIMREILKISRYDMIFQVFENIEQAVAT